MPIGGAEDKRGERAVLRRFVEASGGEGARIAVIPTASRLRDTGQTYVDLFRDLGACEARSLAFRHPEDGARAEHVQALRDATGVFMTGGNQSRLTRVLLDTPCWETLLSAHAGGTNVAGTSAGAAVMSSTMIASGQSGLRPRLGMVSLQRGFGLSSRVLVDQHFSQRERLGRLITALSHGVAPVGLGVDEDTAALFDGHGRFEVVGSGTVSVVRTPAADAPRNGRDADQSCGGLGRPRRAHDATEDGDALEALAAGPVTVLHAGQGYDLRLGRALDSSELSSLRATITEGAQQLAARDPSPCTPSSSPESP
ncbi:MAG: hypothetical protein DHS20C15_13960 [Planctomycetota bacterium]|nr:MAG: hypothetical protein DHS20C15_13960 [Planctomycetota bacterium]